MTTRDIGRQGRDQQVKARKLYIKGSDLCAFGYTVGCPRCTHERRYGPGRTTKGHSDECRQRITDELSKTPEGLRRISAADECINRSIAEDIERQDQAPHVHGGDQRGMANDVPDTDLKF